MAAAGTSIETERNGARRDDAAVPGTGLAGVSNNARLAAHVAFEAHINRVVQAQQLANGAGAVAGEATRYCGLQDWVTLPPGHSVEVVELDAQAVTDLYSGACAHLFGIAVQHRVIGWKDAAGRWR